MSYLPFQGYSYYVNGNQYHVKAIIPYSTYNYRVEVLFPVLPIIEEKHKAPEITLNDFNVWVKSMEFQIQDENDQLYMIWKLLVDVAKGIISYEWCGSDSNYIRILSYYVAHYLELHIKTLKDEEQRMSLNPQKVVESQKNDEKRIDMMDDHYGNYKQTIWGQLFWTNYGTIGKFDIGFQLY